MYDGRQKSARGQYDDARAQAARRAGHVWISNDKKTKRKIKELARRSDHAFALKTGTLYPLLHSLEEKELIISYEKDEYAARPRRYYHLARKGRALLREKEEEWTEFTAAVDRVLRGGGCLGSA